MSYLNYIKDSFQRVLSADAEYRFDITKTIPEKVICFVYTDVFTGEVFRFWENDKTYSQRHFDYDECLIISYNATAEVGSYLNLLHGRPRNIWDALVETRRLYNSTRTGKGALTLLATAEHYKIEDKLTLLEKEENIDLIIRRNKFSELDFNYTLVEQKQILDYCQSDTEVLRQVFIKQVQDIEEKNNLKNDEDYAQELWQTCNRGCAISCVSLVERNGIPVDLKLINKFNDNWPHVKDRLIRKFNKKIDVYTEDLKLSFKQWDKLIIRNNLQHKWKRMKSGHFTTNKDYLKKHLHIEEIKLFNEIRTFQNMTKLTSYVPTIDGRARTSLGMFNTSTGRTSPSSSKYIFSASKWARNFIKPSYGSWLVYLDYKSQEPGVMGYLSQDQNLINAYQSGDIYIHTGKLFDMIPETGTKKSHPKERALFKVLFLATSFGQGPEAVAKDLKCSVSHAKVLLEKYKNTYKDYFKWIDGTIEAGLNRNRLQTVYGWQRWIKHLFTYKNGKKTDIRRSLLNFPIQSHGAEVLRKALIDLTDDNFKLCALVHDAVLIEIPIQEFEERLEEAKQIMVDASIQVVGGPIQVDSEVIKSNYKQKRNEGQDLFDAIMKEIDDYLDGTPDQALGYTHNDNTPLSN